MYATIVSVALNEFHALKFTVSALLWLQIVEGAHRTRRLVHLLC